MQSGWWGAIALLSATAYCTGSASDDGADHQVARDGGGRNVATESVVRNGLNADFFYGRRRSARRVLVMLGGSEGGKMWSAQKPQIDELVDEGYCILSLAYFGQPGTPSHLRAVPLEQFANAVAWLRTRPEATPGQCAIIGVSRGAELGLLLGTIYPEVRAVVAMAPSSVVFPGPPTSIGDALRGQHSAWSRNGQETPFVPLPYSWTTLRGLLTGKRTEMFDVALNDTSAASRAAIRVEQSHGPVLLISFARDQVWPSTRMAKQVVTRLAESGFKLPYEHVVCDGGHSEWADPGCWQRIRGFLRARYPPVAVP